MTGCTESNINETRGILAKKMTTKDGGNDLRISLHNFMIVVPSCMYDFLKIWLYSSLVPAEIRKPFALVSKETNSFCTLSDKTSNAILLLPGKVSSRITPVKQRSFISN